MEFYPTISELINSIEDKELSYRNLHTNVYIRMAYNDREDTPIVSVPYQSILRTYLPYFTDAIVKSAFTPLEKTTYRFSPKKLSLDLYGTTELWSAILDVNSIVSVSQFNLESPIKVYEPKKFFEILNEVLVLEDVIR